MINNACAAEVEPFLGSRSWTFDTEVKAWLTLPPLSVLLSTYHFVCGHSLQDFRQWLEVVNAEQDVPVLWDESKQLSKKIVF